LIGCNDDIKEEVKFLGKSQTGLWEAYEMLQKEYQDLKEKHDSLCNLLGVVAERRQTEGVKVKVEEV
jgi:predicted nuclease with TOPRIM domain